MTKWINSEALASMIGKSLDTAQRIIKAHAQSYPLCVREMKPVGKKSRTYYEVLWNTQTNQPATQPEEENNNGIQPNDNGRTSGDARHSGNGRYQITENDSAGAGAGAATGCVGPRRSEACNQPERDKTRRDKNQNQQNGQAFTPADDHKHVAAFYPHGIPKGGPAAAVLQRLDSTQPTAQDSPTTDPLSHLLRTTEKAPVVLESDNLPAVAANIDFHPDSFDCQTDYVLRLIDKHQLGKACRSAVLTDYFKTLLVADDLRADWDTLAGNPQRIEFARKYNGVGCIPDRLKAEGNPKTVTGRKSAVPDKAAAWIIKTVQDWADDTAPILTATRRRTYYLLQQFLKDDTGIVLSEKQIAAIVKKNNLRHLMDKPQGKAGKKIGKLKGTYPRLPVNSLWLMDGCVPELLYIRGLDGRYTKITCIGIEDVGSRKLLGFREYYSESGTSSVDLFKSVMTQNLFKKGTSSGLIAPTLRPDKGSGFMTSMGACAFAIGKAYAESHHFTIDFKEANAGSPTEKAHLESSWKSVHSTYAAFVQRHFAALGKVDKTPIVANHKRGIEMSALYIDISLEELRASGIAEKFRDSMNSRKRTFTEDNTTRDFIPDERWARYLADLNDDGPITPPLAANVFSAEAAALDMLNVFGYAKHESNVRPDMTIQYKVGYNVPRELGFSVTRSTPVRVSAMPDGSGRLAIFTAKEKKTKTKHDFGAEFLGFATAKAIGGNTEKARYIRNKKAEKMADVLEMAKKDTAYSQILKEIKPFLVSFGGGNEEQRLLDNLVAMKLTPALAHVWIADLCADKTTAEITRIEFKRFAMEARKRLQNILVLPIQKRNIR